MKKLKKLLSIVLAVAMVMSLAVSVGATTQYTITINNTVTGYTYVAYQIFSGDYSSTGTPAVETLSNIAWGSGVDTTNESAIYTALGNVTITNASGDIIYPFRANGESTGTVVSSAEEVATALTTYKDNSEIADAFAKAMNSFLTGGTTLTENTGTSYSATVDEGYYLIKNTVVPTGTSTATSAYMVQVVGTTSIDPKPSVPSLDKTVADVNDSNGSTTQGDTESADYDIGDNVPFTLTATLDTYYEKYSTYKLVFHDTLSAGLDFVSSSVVVTVYTPYYLTTWDTTNTYYTLDTDDTFTEVTSEPQTLDGTEAYYTKTVVNTGYSVETTGTTNYTSGHTCNFEIYIADTNSLVDSGSNAISVTSGSIITVYYEATLNENATFSNTNTAYLEYSNDPNTATSTNTTPEETNTVYTYSLTVTKEDNNGNNLTGAGFALYKYELYTGTTFDTSVTYYTLDITNNVFVVATNPSYGTDTYYTKTTALTQTSTSYDYTFQWDGLDDGYYVLEETTTPTGYNSIDPIYFAVIATHTQGSVSALGVYKLDGTTLLSDGTQDASFTASTNTGELATTVENSSGSNLPETGGIGVTIFYVVGGILVLAAAGVIVISKKRRTEK